MQEHQQHFRPLTLNVLDGMFRSVWERGGQPKAILTGYDTVEKIQQLLQPQQRFTEMKRVTPSINGVQGVPGMEGGFVVATYNGVPIIPSKDVHSDSGGISRLYFLDTDYTYFCTAKPTLYHESGIETGDPFGIKPTRTGRTLSHNGRSMATVLWRTWKDPRSVCLRLKKKKWTVN